MPTAQFVRKAEYARMHGWDRSYISKLQKDGRVVLDETGKLIDWAATDLLIGKTADPSKLGVQQRWEEERKAQQVYAQIHSPSAVAPAVAAAEKAAPAADSAFHQARASKEHYTGQMAKLEYEWLTGLLISRLRVEDAATTAGRSIRDRFLGLAPRIAPELASISDPWEMEQKLTEAFRQVLDDVASHTATLMREVYSDPARGKLVELAREGRARYGNDGERSSPS